jgi:ABC-2 type transport system permease protein
MSNLWTVVRKELQEQISARSSLLIGAVIAILFGFSYSQRVSAQQAQTHLLEGLVFYLSISLTIFLSYSLTTQTFTREKVDRVIETLLCSPVNLREVWLGKVIAVFVPIYLIVLLGVASFLLSSRVQFGHYIIPGAPTIFYFFTGLPMLVGTLMGLMSFLQFMLGMRENRILNVLIFLPLFIAVFGVGLSFGRQMEVTWAVSLGVLALMIALFAITLYLTRYLSKERIVTSLT